MVGLEPRLELVLGERDDIGIGPIAENHRLLLQDAPERREVVAYPCRPFEIQCLGSLSHLKFHTAGEPIGLAPEKVAEVDDDLSVLVSADASDTGRRTLVDVAQ